MSKNEFYPYVKYYDGVWRGNSEEYYLWNPLNSSSEMKMMLMNIGIMIKGETGMDMFSLYIIHEVDFKRDDLRRKIPIWIIKGDFLWEKVHQAIENFVQNCSDRTIENSFSKIRQRMNWEFEGYDNISDVDKEWITWIV